MGRGRQHRGRSLSPAAPSRLLFGLWYGLAIGSLGALHPFLAVSLGREGIAPATASWLMALFPAGLLVSGPLLGWLADRSGRTGPWLRGSAALAALSALGLAAAEGPLAVALCLAALAITRAPLFPLVDALVLDALGGDRDRYGPLRAWGSVAFVVVLQGVGACIDAVPGAPRIAAAVALLGCALLALRLPEPPREAAMALRGGPLGAAIPGLMPLWIVSVLVGFATSIYDFLFAVHLLEIGGGPQLAAAAVGGGVALEVAVMAAAPALMTRLGASRLIALAAVAGALRWAATAAVATPLPAAALQVLHGLSFGAFWIGAIALVGERAPPGRRASAMAMLMATNVGVGPLVAMPVTALVWPIAGGRGAFAVAAVAATAAAVAAWRMLPLRRVAPRT